MKPNNQSPFTNFRQGSTRERDSEREREWWGERKLGYQRRKERNQRRRTGDKSKEQARPHLETSLSVTLTSLFLPSFLLYLFFFLLLMSSFSPPLSLSGSWEVCVQTQHCRWSLRALRSAVQRPALAARWRTDGGSTRMSKWVEQTQSHIFFHHRSLKGKVRAFGGGVVWGFSLSRDALVLFWQTH